MTSFTSVFGGTPINPTVTGYASYSITANTTLSWPFEDGTYPIGSVTDVSASAGLSLTMPSAISQSEGFNFLLTNTGAETFSLKNTSGSEITTLTSGQAKLISLTNNSTANGTWRVTLFGVGSSSLTAGDIDSVSVRASSGVLVHAIPTSSAATNVTITSADRGKLFINTGGAVTYTFPSAATVGNDFYFHVRNNGTGEITIPSVDSGRTVLPISSSATFVSTGSAWYTIGLGTAQSVEVVEVGVGNLSVGTDALGSVAGGIHNTAIGNRAAEQVTAGNSNTAIGSLALILTTSASANTAIGTSAGYRLQTGAENTCVGTESLSGIEDGSENVAIGVAALQGYASVTGTASYNVGVGRSCLYKGDTASSNVGVGHSSLMDCNTGNNNVSVGAYSLSGLTTGSNNIAIGHSSGTDAVKNITTDSNQIVMGNNSSTNAFIKIAWTVTSDARDKTSTSAIPHGLTFVNALQPKSYRFKTSREDDTPIGPVRYGFLAQDILPLEGDSPVVINSDDPDNLKYNSDALVPILVKAIQELTTRVQALENAA